MQVRRKNPIILMLLLWLFAVLLDGCGLVIVGRGSVIDEPFTEKKVQMIRHNETTKNDILDWFGPPIALARPGTVMKVPQWSKSGPTSSDAPAEDFFIRFIRSREQTQKLLVYYYEAARLNWTEFYWYAFNSGAPLYVPTVADRPLTVMRLWILVDDGSGKVVDHQFEKTVEGKPQQETPRKPVTNAVGVEIP